MEIIVNPSMRLEYVFFSRAPFFDRGLYKNIYIVWPEAWKISNSETLSNHMLGLSETHLKIVLNTVSRFRAPCKAPTLRTLLVYALL